MISVLIRWLDERLHLDSLTAPFRHKTVPTHRLSYWYFFGGITLFLFLIQVLTGILLLLYYHPSSNEAFESVQYIMTRVQFGWLIRSIHSWSANLMILTAFAHMFSVLFLKAYRKPRELTWVTGMLLMFLVMGFGFSGYLIHGTSSPSSPHRQDRLPPARRSFSGLWKGWFVRGTRTAAGGAARAATESGDSTHEEPRQKQIGA